MNKKLPRFLVAALTSAATICGVHAGSLNAAGDFACRIFQKQCQAGHSCLISPFSLYLALAMTANGAGGETRQSMARLLGVNPEGNFDNFNKSNSALLQRLNASSSVRISINNAIFADNGQAVDKTFISLCQHEYQAVVQNVDFASPTALNLINNWCKTKTEGKIPSILDQIKPDEKMVLLNTLYFKGNWQTPFDKARTSMAPFYLSGRPLILGSKASSTGASKDVFMMHGSIAAKRLKTSEFDALALPYAGGRQHMYVFLPVQKDKSMDGPKALAHSLTGAKWLEWSQKFEECRAQVAMPKCTFTFKADLGETLKEMGIAQPFGPQANFTKMFGSRSGCIGRVLQKTFIDIDESGTEAAAATAVTMRPMAMRMPEPEVSFVVDRPFVLALVDDESKQFLFLGTVYDPQMR